MLFKEEITTYISTIMRKSNHVYTATSQECCEISAKLGRRVFAIRNLAVQTPFYPKKTLNINSLYFEDGNNGIIVLYDEEPVVMYELIDSEIVFNFLNTDDKDWQTDLQMLYFETLREY